MNLKEDILIEQFLRNQLSEQEVIDFNKKLKTDLEFNKQFQFEKQLFETINEEQWSFIENKNTNEVATYTELFRNDDIKNLKKTLEDENKLFNEKKQDTSFNKKWIYLVAAIFLLFFTISKFMPTQNTNQQLFATYFNETEIPSLVNRGNNQNELNKAQQHFENKNYSKAIPIFKNLIQNSESNSTLLIYLGISEMENNQFDKSLQTFDILINNKSLITTKGYWFKALLYLKIDKIKKSKEILNIIVKEKHYNYKNASLLLKALK